jgi:hypothetical protein
VQVLAPVVSEYCPAVQAMHWLERLAPDVFEYVPVLQLVQALAPSVLE